MDNHPIDPTALVTGLLFGLAGLALFADQRWEEVDATAFTAAGVCLIGVLLLGLVIARALRDDPVDADPSDADAIETDLFEPGISTSES